MARAFIEYDDRELRSKTKGIPERVNKLVSAVVMRNALWGQGFARVRAPWTDRTGVARSGLFAIPQSRGGHHEITLSHSAEYGIWLEIANSGKYQIIMPTIRATGSHLMGELRGLLKKL